MSKSKKNLTRFEYESSAFIGWRMHVTKAGTQFVRYFPDKKHGGPKKSLKQAEMALLALREKLAEAKLVKGKLPATEVKKLHKVLDAFDA